MECIGGEGQGKRSTVWRLTWEQVVHTPRPHWSRKRGSSPSSAVRREERKKVKTKSALEAKENTRA